VRLIALVAAYLSVEEGWRAVAKQIQIDKSENRLRLYEGGKVIRSYPVATGKSTTVTPEGRFTIVFKTTNPGWTNPDTGEFFPGGSPRNPLGSRWLGLSIGGGRRYGIHGTNAPWSIGQSITHGCVRMQNWAVEELYRLTPLGTVVVIRK
jgi:lipoprotein-anchoring transpeptidase ErfK/SrfK